MSKLPNQFLNMMKLSDDDEDDGIFTEEFDDYEDEVEEQPKRRFGLFGKKKEVEEEPVIEPVVQKTAPAVENRRVSKTSRKASNIVSITRGDEVKIIKPQSFNESKTITDYLRANKTVVVNLEGVEIPTAQRIIDCIAGASYALGGTLNPISSKIFILAPKDVDISGDFLEALAGDTSISPELGNI